MEQLLILNELLNQTIHRLDVEFLYFVYLFHKLNNPQLRFSVSFQTFLLRHVQPLLQEVLVNPRVHNTR